MQSDNEGTSGMVEQYRVVLNRTKQASIGQIIISTAMLPVFRGRFKFTEIQGGRK